MDRNRQPAGRPAVMHPRGAAAVLYLFALIVLGLAWAAPGAARGQTPPVPGQTAPPMTNRPETSVEITVESGPDGVTIYIEVEEETSGTPGSPGSPGTPDTPESSDPPSCTAAPVNVGAASTEWVVEGLEANPGTFPWAATCDDGFFGIAWVPTDAGGAPDVVVGEPPIPPIDPALVRASVFQIVPLPQISVGVNPGTGLVAMPAWFWVRGYSGGTLSGSAALDRSMVEVEITPTRYRWSFGDGSVRETHSLGRAYPQKSDIRHRYERSSLDAGGTFPVRLRITWSARYSENGGPWLPLDPITRTYTRAYAVQQLQSVLTANR